MTIAEIIERCASLPEDKQQELARFAEQLLAQFGQNKSHRELPGEDSELFAAWLAGEIAPNRDTPLEQEPAYGLWRDRTEMNDSVEYVRSLRANWRNHPV